MDWELFFIFAAGLFPVLVAICMLLFGGNRVTRRPARTH